MYRVQPCRRHGQNLDSLESNGIHTRAHCTADNTSLRSNPHQSTTILKVYPLGEVIYDPPKPGFKPLMTRPTSQVLSIEQARDANG